MTVPVYRIFGSEELSVHSEGIAELAGDSTLEIHPDDAVRLGVSEGGCVSINSGPPLAVNINPTLVAGCVGYPVGVPGAPWLAMGEQVSLTRVANNSKIKEEDG